MTDFETCAFLSAFRAETRPGTYLEFTPPARNTADWCCKAHGWHRCNFTNEMGGKADPETPGMCQCGTDLLNLPLEIDTTEYHLLPTFCTNGPGVEGCQRPAHHQIIDAESDTNSDCSSSGPACYNTAWNLSLDALISQDPLLPTRPESTYGITELTGLYTLPISYDAQGDRASSSPVSPDEAPLTKYIDPALLDSKVISSGNPSPASHTTRHGLARAVTRAPSSTSPMSSPSRYSPYTSPVTATKVSKPRGQKKKGLISSSRRNAQVTSQQAAADANVQSIKTKLKNGQCPYCDHVQRNDRSPDFKRHVESHIAGVPRWVCCGVPLADALGKGVPETIVYGQALFEFGGVIMVGGCRKTFSRKDALKRHVTQLKVGVCFTEFDANHQPGNQEETNGQPS